MKTFSSLTVAALVGLGVAAFGAQTGMAAEEVAAASAPACDDVAAVAAAITAAVAVNPSQAASIAGKETARCPADAAAIATAAVNADPNGAEDIVDAVLAALPDDLKGNDVLTGAITELAGAAGPNPPDRHDLGAPLLINWTDPHQASPR